MSRQSIVYLVITKPVRATVHISNTRNTSSFVLPDGKLWFEFQLLAASSQLRENGVVACGSRSVHLLPRLLLLYRLFLSICPRLRSHIWRYQPNWCSGDNYCDAFEINHSVRLSRLQAHLSCSPASAGFLFNLLFDPEDGGDMFLRNFGLCPKYTVLQPSRPYSP
jgi:hypothetical protein